MLFGEGGTCILARHDLLIRAANRRFSQVIRLLEECWEKVAGGKEVTRLLHPPIRIIFLRQNLTTQTIFVGRGDEVVPALQSAELLLQNGRHDGAGTEGG